MEKSIFLEKYPVYSLVINKDETNYKTTTEIIEFLKAKVEAHPIAKFISIFDHYSHTTSIDGDVLEGLKDAQNLIFCFGKAIPNSKMLAARPRSIGVCEFKDKFHIDFMEAPKEDLTLVMSNWVKELKAN